MSAELALDMLLRCAPFVFAQIVLPDTAAALACVSTRLRAAVDSGDGEAMHQTFARAKAIRDAFAAGKAP